MNPAYVLDGLYVILDSNKPQNYIVNNLRQLQYCTISDDNSLCAFDNYMLSLTTAAFHLNPRCKRINYERTRHILGGYQCSFQVGSKFIAHIYLRPLKGDWKGDLDE